MSSKTPWVPTLYCKLKRGNRVALLTLVVMLNVQAAAVRAEEFFIRPDTDLTPLRQKMWLLGDSFVLEKRNVDRRGSDLRAAARYAESSRSHSCRNFWQGDLHGKNSVSVVRSVSLSSFPD